MRHYRVSQELLTTEAEFILLRSLKYTYVRSTVIAPMRLLEHLYLYVSSRLFSVFATGRFLLHHIQLASFIVNVRYIPVVCRITGYSGQRKNIYTVLSIVVVLYYCPELLRCRQSG